MDTINNRAGRRRRHRGVAIRKSAASRRLHRPEWPPVPTEAERAALSDFRWRRWAERSKRFASAFYRCTCGFETWGPGDAEHYEVIAAHEAMCDVAVSA